MFKVSKQGLKTSAVITLLISILDFFRGKEVDFISIVITFFVLLAVYELIGFMGSILKKFNK